MGFEDINLVSHPKRIEAALDRLALKARVAMKSWIGEISDDGRVETAQDALDEWKGSAQRELLNAMEDMASQLSLFLEEIHRMLGRGEETLTPDQVADLEDMTDRHRNKIIAAWRAATKVIDSATLSPTTDLTNVTNRVIPFARTAIRAARSWGRGVQRFG